MPAMEGVSWEHKKEYKGVNVLYLGGDRKQSRDATVYPSYFTAKTPVSDIAFYRMPFI